MSTPLTTLKRISRVAQAQLVIVSDSSTLISLVIKFFSTFALLWFSWHGTEALTDMGEKGRGRGGPGGTRGEGGV